MRGIYEGNVGVFRGIPYGNAPTGKFRFIRSGHPEPWSGIKDAIEYGHMAMQPSHGTSTKASTPDLERKATEVEALYAGAFRNPPAQMSEDCLTLNVWSPGFNDGRLRPVMVWLHGGGYRIGSGDLRWTDGVNLARKRDVVVVSLNHRLNIFGFLFLGDLGNAKFAESGNMGMLDIVLALEWVRDNIASFGGDPGSVTVFGHSGGGGKVIALMAMPAAKGLFHKAIVQSGPSVRAIPREEATKTTQDVLAELKIGKSDLDQLQTVNARRLLHAMCLILTRDRDPDWMSDWRSWNRQFAPVADGVTIPELPLDLLTSKASQDLPLLVGTTACELSTYNHSFDELELHKRMEILGFSPGERDRLLSAYRASRHGASPSDIFSAIASDKLCRMIAIQQAEQKAQQGVAPVFMYLFTYNSPSFGGKFKSVHGSELPFVFDNIDKARGLVGALPDPRSESLANNLSLAWTAFARNGNPSHKNLPNWKPYSMSKRWTMILDFACKLVQDPWAEDRRAMEPFFPISPWVRK